MGRPVAVCGVCRARLCRTNPRAAPYPEIGVPSGRGVFARLAERNVGPAFQGELEIHARGRQIHQRAAVIERQVLVRPAAELLHPARIRALDPARGVDGDGIEDALHAVLDRKSTRLNSSHLVISYAVFCLKKKKKIKNNTKSTKTNSTIRTLPISKINISPLDSTPNSSMTTHTFNQTSFANISKHL